MAMRINNKFLSDKGPGPEVRVCANIASGLRARIEGWSTRPKEKASEERRRK
jgi:hypothetical protein